jgi:hypothetical protein
MIRRTLGRRLGAVLAVAVGVAALASLAPRSPAISACAGAGPNHASLVVEHGDGSVVTRCVAFSGAGIGGKDLLDASGVAWSGQAFGGYGVAVCAIDSEPAHYTTCPGKDDYWAVFVSRGGGAWQLTVVGISELTLADGDAEGFRYVPAAGTPAAPPAPAGVCATEPAATATLAASPVLATASPTPAVPPAAASTRTPIAAPSQPTLPPATATATATASAPAGTSAATAPGAAGTPAPRQSGSEAVGAAVATPHAGASDPAPDAAPGPAPSGGLDIGLLLAAIAGGALAGLALLRLAAARRPGAGPPR